MNTKLETLARALTAAGTDARHLVAAGEVVAEGPAGEVVVTEDEQSLRAMVADDGRAVRTLISGDDAEVVAEVVAAALTGEALDVTVTAETVARELAAGRAAAVVRPDEDGDGWIATDVLPDVLVAEGVRPTTIRVSADLTWTAETGDGRSITDSVAPGLTLRELRRALRRARKSLR